MPRAVPAANVLESEPLMPVAQPVPEGFHTVTPCIVVGQADQAIAFYKSAFGAEELFRTTCGTSGDIINAKLRIGDSMVMLSDEFPLNRYRAPGHDRPPAVTIHLYVEDVEKVFAQAIEAGATVTVPLGNAFWGDRCGQLRDPFGHVWTVATHIEDLTPAEIDKRAQQVFANHLGNSEC
jgi:uncharacterized glyoxalase superfamily protein PhnB